LTGCGSDSGENYSGDKVKSKTIAAGSLYSLILNNGRVYAAGWNNYGQLGLGDDVSRGNFTEITDLKDKIIAAIAVSDHSLALSDEGRVYAAGHNNHGQLGLGDTNDRNVFTEIADLKDRNIIAVDASDHSFALSNDGRVYAAGLNDYGELGLGDNISRSAFTEVTDLRDKNITAIIAGFYHSLALSVNGRVYAVGSNDSGQLGLGDSNDRNVFTEVADLKDKNIIAIDARGHSLALSDEGRVYAAGSNNFGQLGLGDSNDRNTFTEITDLRDKNITAVAAGFYHSFAVSRDNKVYATGRNSSSQLGLGDSNDRNVFTEITNLRDKNITAVVTGNRHSFAISNDGKVYAAGLNGYGELGLGDTNNRNVFTEVIMP
jgi:alpha-tubulin suppressor-like RCC1 family protein